MRVVCKEWKDRGSNVELRGPISALWGPKKPCLEPGPSLADRVHRNRRAPLHPERVDRGPD